MEFNVYYNHTIMLDESMQDEQTMEQTFCHELVHAMMFERKLNLESMGLSNAQMEEVVDNLGIALHQVLLDNRDIALTAEEFDTKYPQQQDPIEEVKQVAPKVKDVKEAEPKVKEE